MGDRNLPSGGWRPGTAAPRSYCPTSCTSDGGTVAAWVKGNSLNPLDRALDTLGLSWVVWDSESKDAAYLVDVSSGRLLGRVSINPPEAGAEWSPDGSALVASGPDTVSV